MQLINVPDGLFDNSQLHEIMQLNMNRIVNAEYIIYWGDCTNAISKVKLDLKLYIHVLSTLSQPRAGRVGVSSFTLNIEYNID